MKKNSNALTFLLIFASLLTFPNISQSLPKVLNELPSDYAAEDYMVNKAKNIFYRSYAWLSHRTYNFDSEIWEDVIHAESKKKYGNWRST